MHRFNLKLILISPANAFAVPKGILPMIWNEKVGIGFIKELSPLLQADSPDACFDLLMKGEIEAVAVNEFWAGPK